MTEIEMSEILENSDSESRTILEEIFKGVLK